MEIIRKLAKFHNIGFWKNNSLKNWELDTSETNKQKYIGLKNLSSTCYMNSILQQIFMIPMLRETILSIKNSKENTVLFELQLLFSALKVYESQYYDPSSFVLANKLNFYEQMDADEYFGIFIDKIESDIKNLYPKDSENKYKDLFRFFFGIKALDELKFVDCNHKRYNEFFYNNIQLEVKGFNNLDSSMKNYFKTEIMDGENKINCEECNMKRTCHKRQIFKSLPNILVINLKRFEFDYNTMLKSKLNNYFEFPFELDMKEYLIENHKEINTKYELTGITIHFGFSDYGHYYDLIKSPEGKWYKFNDNTISEFDEKDIPHEAFGERESEEEDFIKEFEEKDNGQNNAYILIYKKINFDEDTIDNISKNYICDLASPPYGKFSNINDKIKSIINIKMFKFWTIQSIVSPGYQNFVLNLLAYDLSRMKNNKLKEQNKVGNNNKNNIDEIFEFGLIYFFNIEIRVIFRQKEKSFLSEFVDIIISYIEKDIKKAKYILEEFSNFEVINEFLVSCPTKSGSKAINKIIYTSFKKIFDYILLNEKSNKANDDISDYNLFLFKFINTYVLFITYNIRSIQIENVNTIFYDIIKTNEAFIKYLKKKNLEKWVASFYNDDDDDDDEEMYLNSILNEKHFPKIKSTHKILSEKKLEFNGTKIPDNENDFEMEQILMNRNRYLSGNTELIKKLFICFRSID
jgi:ubiquitin C-terminal hydrolase